MKKWDEINSLEFRLYKKEKEDALINDSKSVINPVKDEFIKLGFDVLCIDDVINICMSTRSIKYRDIVFSYLKNATYDNERFLLRECYMSSDCYKYIPFFLKEFVECKKGQERSQISIGVVLRKSFSIDFMDDYIKILRNENVSVVEPPLDDARGFILDAIGKIDCPESRKILLEFIDDIRFTPYCIRGLGNFCDEKYRSIFFKYLKSSDTVFRSLAKKAIEKLDKEKEKNNK